MRKFKDVVKDEGNNLVKFDLTGYENGSRLELKENSVNNEVEDSQVFN